MWLREQGWKPAHAAKAQGVSRPCAYRWVKRYDEGIRKGGILMGVRPRNDEDASHLETAWKTNRAQDVYR